MINGKAKTTNIGFKIQFKNQIITTSAVKDNTLLNSIPDVVAHARASPDAFSKHVRQKFNSTLCVILTAE
jgi:hypothetical protein